MCVQDTVPKRSTCEVKMAPSKKKERKVFITVINYLLKIKTPSIIIFRNGTYM